MPGKSLVIGSPSHSESGSVQAAELRGDRDRSGEPDGHGVSPEARYLPSPVSRIRLTARAGHGTQPERLAAGAAGPLTARHRPRALTRGRPGNDDCCVCIRSCGRAGYCDLHNWRRVAGNESLCGIEHASESIASRSLTGGCRPRRRRRCGGSGAGAGANRDRAAMSVRGSADSDS